MRSLSLAQASRCETAKNPQCKCRCGGKLHGKMRSADGNADRVFFEGLPADDPHHVRSAEEKRQIAAMKRAVAKAKGQGFLWPLFIEEDVESL